MKLETALAIAGLVVCALLVLRMALGAKRTARFDRRVRQGVGGLNRRVKLMLGQRRLRGQAKREAKDLIERARRRHDVDRDGNVYRPRSFNGGDDQRH